MIRKFRASLQLFLAAAVLTSAVSARAQSRSQVPRSPINSIREKYMESIAAPKKDVFQADVKMEVQSYATELPGQQSKSTLLSAHLNFETGQGRWGGKGDIMVGRYTDLKYTIFSVQELYVSHTPNDGFSAALGRKDEFWSDVDQNWDLGLWEPRYLEEPLRPVDQGITGLLLKAKESSTDFEGVIYGSPVFIPTMSPPLSVQNGDFVSDSRWNTVPPKSTQVMGTETKLSYNLDIPELSKLVSKPGGGMRMSFGRSAAWGPWISVNAASKPINSIFLRYKYDLAGARQTGLVNMMPMVRYHALWGADAGWNLGAARVSVSYLEDRPFNTLPNNDADPDGVVRSEWIEQTPESVRVYGAHAEWRVENVLLDPLDLKVDYLTARQSATQDLNAKGENKGAVLPYRLQFTNALQLRAGTTFRLARLPVGLGFRALREFDQKGNIYTFEGKLWPTRAIALNAGFDILGPDDGSEANDDDRFLNKFRTNDRMFAGVSYVF